MEEDGQVTRGNTLPFQKQGIPSKDSLQRDAKDERAVNT